MGEPSIRVDAPFVAAQSQTDQPVLCARGVTKDFPGVRALKEMDFDLRAGNCEDIDARGDKPERTPLHLAPNFRFVLYLLQIEATGWVHQISLARSTTDIDITGS